MNVINSLPEKSKKNANFIQLDLESFKSIANFANEIKSKYQKIDILINNAGMMARIIIKLKMDLLMHIK